MIKVVNKDKYFKMFEEYSHSIPVIYSSLEGQYDGELYVDKEEDPEVAILFTPFEFHYVAGNTDVPDLVDMLDDMMFKGHLKRTNKKEGIFFGPNEKWQKILAQTFKRHNGIIDKRMMFRLNRETYDKNRINNDNSIIETRISFEKEQCSQKEYPVSRVFIDQKCVSFCSGFMLGKGHAEININTEEKYRGNGYARGAAYSLIDELLKNDIEPDWCTWPYRLESQNLARSLGFDLQEEVPAYIWVEDECGKIQG